MAALDRPQLLAIAPLYAPALAEVERKFIVHRRAGIGQDELPAPIRERIRGVITTGLRGFSAPDLEPLPNLEIVACFGQGHGTLDVAAARARGVIVTNTPEWTHEAVADVALGLMLGVMRRLCEADRFVRAGRWLDGAFPMSTDLRGKTCGVIGLGAIGRAVARRAEMFGMSVVYHGPSPKADVRWRHYPELAEMAADADCLVVACAVTPSTHRLIDRRILSALGPKGYLINVSRGAIVDQPALIKALQSRAIAGAGLEVFDDEPRVPVELRALEQVMLLPHLGSSTHEIRAERTARLLANLRAHFAGQPPPDRVV
ncbi:MAG: 2-hydroxyacid dehydrogenase [Proteobacteria bacterium]|nr:2-hydroxyacid dehydrogenase [Burkholderiales bacterium]